MGAGPASGQPGHHLPPGGLGKRWGALWLEARTSQDSAVMNPHVFRAPGPGGQGSHATLPSKGETGKEEPQLSEVTQGRCHHLLRTC